MLKLPRISIVTPSFNQGPFLERTLQSVLSQNYPNLEYIVIDGGSTDGSAELLDRYSDRLAYWCSEPDEGHYAAVNKGFDKSTGDVLAFLNSDDIYLPWTLATIGQLFGTIKDLSWVVGTMPAQIDSNGAAIGCGRIVAPSRRAFFDGAHIPFSNCCLGTIPQEGVFWSRSLWESTGRAIDTSYGLAGDFELWSRFIQVAEPVSVGVPLAAMTRHLEQRSADTAKYRSECEEALARLPDELKTGSMSKRLRRAVLSRPGLRDKGWRLWKRLFGYESLYAEKQAELDAAAASWKVQRCLMYR